MRSIKKSVKRTKSTLTDWSELDMSNFLFLHGKDEIQANEKYKFKTIQELKNVHQYFFVS